MGRSTSIYVIIAFLLCEFTMVVVISGKGTTPQLKDIFLGRCYQYQVLSEQNQMDSLKMNINCTELWGAFFEAFAFKHPCNITDESYDKFFGLLHNPKKLRNALFWSGAHDLISDFAFVNDDYVTLEDTLTGYLMNNLVWCGSNMSSNGMNETFCEEYSVKCNSMYPAWKLASAKFAQRAAGVTQTLLNASRSGNRPAYAKGSYFRTIESPRLRVDKIIVYLASTIGTPIRERCATSKSIKELEMDVHNRSITVECIDQPNLVLGVYCIKYPKSSHCTTKKCTYQGEVDSSEDWRHWKMLAIALCGLLIIILIGGVFVWKVRSARHVQTLHVTNQKLSVHGLKNQTPVYKTEKNGNNIWL